MADELNLEAERAAFEAWFVSDAGPHGRHVNANWLRRHASGLYAEGETEYRFQGWQAARRAAPAAAQLDADLPPLSEDQILAALGSITHEVPPRLPPGWLKFAHAIEAKVRAQYAERIRLLERDLTVSGGLWALAAEQAKKRLSEADAYIERLEATRKQATLQELADLGQEMERVQQPTQSIDTLDFVRVFGAVLTADRQRVKRGPVADPEFLAAYGALIACIDGRTASTAAWQPIETAPKDGTSILLYTASGMVEARWSYGEWEQSPCYATYDGCGGVALSCVPIYWMPLPAAPSPLSGTEEAQ